MQFKRYFELVSLLAAFACLGSAQPKDTKLGTLTIKLYSSLGGKLPAGRVSIYSKQGSVVYAERAGDEASAHLPYGEYTVTFTGEFVKPVRRAVTIDRSECFMVLGADMERVVLDMHNDPVSISIRAQPNTSCAPNGVLWAKLVGVYSDQSLERRIGPAGFALFEPVEVGTYVLIIVDGQLVRAAHTVTSKGQVTVIEVQLQACE